MNVNLKSDLPQTYMASAWARILDTLEIAFKQASGNWDTSSWAATRTGWTDVGSPTVTAKFRVVNRQVFFQVKVVPGTTVATTAGTSYIALPLTAQGLGGDASMVNASTNVAVGACVIDVANSRVYVPTQVASGNTFVIAGWYEW